MRAGPLMQSTNSAALYEQTLLAHDATRSRAREVEHASLVHNVVHSGTHGLQLGQRARLRCVWWLLLRVSRQ